MVEHRIRVSNTLQGLGNLANIVAVVFVIWAYYHPYGAAVASKTAADSNLPTAPVNVLMTNPVLLGVLGLILGGGLNVAAVVIRRRERQAVTPAAQPQGLPYPTIRIFRHKEARKHSDAVFHQVADLFANAGWRVESHPTDLIEHENGIRIAGKAGFDREAAKWGLDALGIKWIPDERRNPPETLEVIVGRYDAAPQIGEADLKAVKVLERYHTALASLGEDFGRLKRQKDAGGSIAASAFIDIDHAVKKMRKELVDLSPGVFTTSEALDFRETVYSDPETSMLAEERVPKEIAHLMGTLLGHWGRHGESVGITPLRSNNDPIVRLV